MISRAPERGLSVRSRDQKVIAVALGSPEATPSRKCPSPSPDRLETSRRAAAGGAASSSAARGGRGQQLPAGALAHRSLPRTLEGTSTRPPSSDAASTRSR